MRAIDYSLFDYGVPDFAARLHKEAAPVMACARPYGLFHKERPARAVLLLHGFTGYPAELARPGIDLYEAGLDVLAIRYPGHGTSARDFLRTDDRMWLAAAEDAAAWLEGLYEEVVLVGHSMGGLIALILAARRHVARAALLAPAVSIRNHPWRACLARPFVRSIDAGWKQDLRYKPYYPGSPADDLPMAEQYWKRLYPKGVASLLRMARTARRAMGTLDSDLLVLFGDGDLSVDAGRSVRAIARGNQGRTVAVTLEGGSHLLPYDWAPGVQDEAARLVAEHLAGAGREGRV